MTYQRVLVKDSARQALRGKKPRRRMAVFLLLCAAMLIVSQLPALIANRQFLPAPAGPSSPALDSFFTLAELSPIFWLCHALTLFLTLMAWALPMAGACAYCLDLWRGRGTDCGSFLSGFSRFPSAMALGLMIAFFALLWTLLGFSAVICILWLFTQGLHMDLLPLLAAPADQPVLLSLAVFLLFLLWGLFAAFLLNRTLRYSLSFFVLMDHPRWTARQCLNESKALMKHRKWQFVVLVFSFLGWELVIALACLAAFLLWPLLLSFFPVAVYPGIAFWLLRIMLIFYLVLLVGFALTLPLWLMNYVGVSLAGFYDFAQSDARNRPTPPRSWQIYQ